MSEREEFEQALSVLEQACAYGHGRISVTEMRARVLSLYATAIRERDEAREILQTLTQQYEAAPGLPLENAPQEALEKWTDTLIAIGMLLSTHHRALRNAP